MPRITHLPEFGREESLEYWGLNPSAHWAEVVEDDPSVDGFLEEAAGGWSIIDPAHDVDTGLVAHRGVTHPDEYVDYGLLRPIIERELGFSYEQIRSVYRQGPLSADQRELRGQIDARLLALSRSGGNLLELARALGWAVRPAQSGGDRCNTLENALDRARQAEALSA